MKIIELEETDSTNEYCKRVDCGKDLCVIAARQTGGKGTKGRSFVSADGGIYLSLMRHYKNFSAENAFEILVGACVAVCKTLEEFGLTPIIRWANDVLVNGKKICGMLIENTLSGGTISRSIVGIGLNVNNAFDGVLSQIATSMCGELNKILPLEKVKKALLKNLENGYSIEDYRKRINWFGKSVTLKTESGQREVIARAVTEKGLLVVDWCGNMLEINSAEISLRL